MFGKSRRMGRLFVSEKKRCLLSPLDHGAWLGPVKGIDKPEHIVEEVVAGGANAILAGPGFLKRAAPAIPSTLGVVLRLSLTAGLSRQGTQETPIADLDTALAMDVDAVAVSVFFGRDGDLEIYHWLAEVIQACRYYDMPVLAEMMPPEADSYDSKAIAHASRIGVEIGADIIKTNYCGEVDPFKKVVESVGVPLIVAGGPKQAGDPPVEKMVSEVVRAGAAGVAIGRRVWQADNPRLVTQQIHKALFT
jgi:fructose-bisphosphate aldolase/2-amino-3,7-dideoxy-D-threo-hept-6-ulosonate synthase